MAENPEREIQRNVCESPERVNDESENKETEGLFSYLSDILQKCTEKCFAPVRFEKVSSCLREVRERNPAAFDSIVPQLIKHLEANVKQELEMMFQQENLVSLCYQLDQITSATTDTKDAWRPSGIPSEDIKDHVMHVKLQFREKLREKLKQIQDENEVLKNRLTSTGCEIADTEERIIAKHKELQEISTACEALTSCNNNEDSKYLLENIIKEFKR